MAPPPPQLVEEFVEEILLRLPPEIKAKVELKNRQFSSVSVWFGLWFPV
jgi:hypothetical protein